MNQTKQYKVTTKWWDFAAAEGLTATAVQRSTRFSVITLNEFQYNAALNEARSLGYEADHMTDWGMANLALAKSGLASAKRLSKAGPPNPHVVIECDYCGADYVAEIGVEPECRNGC